MTADSVTDWPITGVPHGVAVQKPSAAIQLITARRYIGYKGRHEPGGLESAFHPLRTFERTTGYCISPALRRASSMVRCKPAC